MNSPAHLPRALLACLAALAVLCGCQNTRRSARPAAIPATFTPATGAEAPVIDQSLLQRPNYEYRLGPGDVLDVEVLGDVNTQSTTVVGPDGKIYFYLLPGIDVWGLTIPQARQRIVEGMQRFVREAQPVSISLRKSESQRIWVLGRLNKPGIYSMTGPMTLLDALSEAGGPASMGSFTSASGQINLNSSLNSGRNSHDDAADLSRAFVIRQGRLLRVDFSRLLREGDMSQNIYLEPGDFVYLPSNRIGNVHVLGAVEAPRAVEYTSQLTVAQAVAHAGGTLRRQSHLSQVAVVRGSLTQPQIALVDLNAILAGQAPDVALEPQDIVFVPHSPYRVLNRYVDMILDTFVRTVGVNEGARAVDAESQIGVTVPLGGL